MELFKSILNQFIVEHKPNQITYISDNRFSCDLPEKIGFTFDHEIEPDFYWWKNHNRFHRHELENKSTILELQESYKRIWDLGKKCWVLYPTKRRSAVMQRIDRWRSVV